MTDCKVMHGDCLDVMRGMADASVDAIVSDPPYGLAFMGKQWDHGVPGVPFWTEALRVAKPGAHLLAFGGTRTFHRLAVAIEDAGWEIRDNIGWAHQKHLFCQCDALPYSHDRNDLQRVRQGVPDVSPAASAGEAPDVLPRVQRREPGPRVGDAREQGARGVDGGVGGVVPREDDRTSQPGVEGRRDAVSEERELRRDQVRASAGVGAFDGTGGRVHHGAPADYGRAGRSPAHPDRGGASPEPRPDGQHIHEPRTLAVEWVAQGGGAWPCCGGCGEPLAPPLFQGPLAWNFGSGFPKSHNLDGAWEGWGTALKPAWEPVIVARKPLVGTVARNVAEFGTGALNVDGCRIGTGDALVRPPVMRRDNAVLGRGLGAGTQVEPVGRWPANVMLDEEAAAMLDAQTGTLASGKPGRRRKPHKTGSMAGTVGMLDRDEVGHDDFGGASRFFYVAKASRSEREAGLREAGLREAGIHRYGAGIGEGKTPDAPAIGRNTHPTVKPVAVMQWLCRLVTPPGGLVLDPFTGSGTTGVAALREGFRFVGIEREAEYVEIARARMAHALSIRQPSLFESARELTQEDDR